MICWVGNPSRSSRAVNEPRTSVRGRPPRAFRARSSATLLTTTVPQCRVPDDLLRVAVGIERVPDSGELVAGADRGVLRKRFMTSSAASDPMSAAVATTSCASSSSSPSGRAAVPGRGGPPRRAAWIPRGYAAAESTPRAHSPHPAPADRAPWRAPDRPWREGGYADGHRCPRDRPRAPATPVKFPPARAASHVRPPSGSRPPTGSPPHGPPAARSRRPPRPPWRRGSPERSGGRSRPRRGPVRAAARSAAADGGK